MRKISMVLQDFWFIAKPFWTQSEQRRMAYLLLLAVVALNLASVGLNVWFNHWYNGFYNSIQEKDFEAFQTLLLQFSLVAVGFIVVAVYQLYLGQMLQLRWRQWLTEQWLGDWLSGARFYHLQLFGGQTDNPDQRLAEDLRLFTGYSLQLSLGLLSATVTLGSFLHILWTLSGAFTFSISGAEIVIPGYMVWVALVYAMAGTWLTHLIGRPLTRLNFAQQRYEADFRFHLVRLRENVEGVALQRGADTERQALIGRFSSVVRNYLAIMGKQKQLTWFTSGYGQAAVVFPFLVGAPKYFGGSLALGGLMQTVSAFGQVQGALSYLVTAYTEIAEWRAVIERLRGFERGIAAARRLAAENEITQAASADGGIAVSALRLSRPDAAPLLVADGLRLAPGAQVMIEGPSGLGKTTFLRALAGLWPFGSGEVRRPPDEACLFLPQKPYLPVASLRAVLCYPDAPRHFTDAALIDALRAMDLPGLTELLDEEANWTQRLSGGEQQRVQLARALLRKPAWLFLDEATAALDGPGEARVLSALKAALPDTGVIAIGHRPPQDTATLRILRLEPGRGGEAARLALTA